MLGFSNEQNDGVNIDEEEMDRRRRLFERFMASYGPGSLYLYEAPKVHSHPCVRYTMRVSVKKVRVSWSHRSNRRFFPERRGSTFPVPVCRVVGPDDDQVEQVVERSGAPGEPNRPGIVSGIFEQSYYQLEHSREKGVIEMEGSPVPLREVAVIRGMPGGRGLCVTSHVKHLVVRLHDIIFLLPGPSAAVDICFCEQWFRLPARWKEERLYSEDGVHFIDIASPVENLVKKLNEMLKQEAGEMERQRLETVEEKERRLLEEEEVRKRGEEERRKVCELKEEERMKMQEEAAAKPPVSPVWDAALWDIKAPPATSHCYSKYKLTMDSNKQVSCKCVEQEGLRDMLKRMEDGEALLPISKPAPLSASSKALEIVGFVEWYSDLETVGFGWGKGRFMDQSGRTLSSVLMVSQSAKRVLTIKAFVHKLDILLDDGLILTICSGASVDIHCDDISSSELLTTNWIHQILCKNTDCEGMISFSLLLVQLKKKLNLKLRKGELALYSMCAIDCQDDEEEHTRRRQQQKWQHLVRVEPKSELAEVELRDYSLLFPLDAV